MSGKAVPLTITIAWVLVTGLVVWTGAASAATAGLQVDGSPGSDADVARGVDLQGKGKGKANGKSGGDEGEAETTQEQSGNQNQEESQDDREVIPAKSRLTVKVLARGSGKKISGARVEISGAARGSARTNADGVVTLTGLDQGEISVEVSAKGWSSLKKSLRLDQEREEIVLKLSPLETRLTVSVVGVEDDGRKVSVVNCTVKVSPENGSPVEKRTDKLGTAVFAKLARGEIRVNVMAESWETGFEKKTLSLDEAKVEIRIVRRHPPGKDAPKP